jgi:hypothetical protein
MNNIFLTLLLVVALLVAYYFATEYFFLDLTGSGWKKARAEFPAVAKELGLTLEAPKYDFQIGKISGTYRGYAVRVLPDDGAMVQLDMGTESNIELDTERERSVEHGALREITFRSAELNDFFPTRYAGDSVSERLAASDKLAQFAAQFRKRWGRQVARLRVDNRYIRCYFPNGRQRYIPARSIGPILDDLANLADILKSP